MARTKRNINRGKGKKIYSIVVDGETEVWYFQMMRANENLSQITVKPELPKKKSLKQQYEYVVELSNQGYEKVFWLLDLDAIIHDNQLEAFKGYFQKTNKIRNVEVLVNSPCIEFWHLLHFKSTSQFTPKCAIAERQLKKYLPDYEKSEKYYKKANNDIYKRLKSKQATAVTNARKLGEFSNENSQTAKAEVYKILQELNVVTK